MALASNSSPIIVLAKCGLLHLLPNLYGEVFLPPAVAGEIGRRQDAASTVPSLPWVVERTPGNAALVANLMAAQHPGEAEAIALALVPGEIAVALDDRRARRLARDLGLEVIGTAGVIAVAKSAGVLAEARPALDAARAAGLYLSDVIYAELLARVGEAASPR